VENENILVPPIVSPGYVGVKVRLGTALDQPLGEGIHFVVPFITGVEIIDTRIQRCEVAGNEAASKDLQVVTSSMVVNYHIVKDEAVKLYRQIGMSFENVIIAPSVQETFKAATAEFTAESLITQRQKVSEIIRKSLQERLEPFGIMIDQVNITNFSFSAEFDKAIEAKVTAEQKALQAENELKRFEFEAKQAVAKAEGEAEALIAKAKAEAEGLKLKLEYAKPEMILLNAVEKWDGKLPVTMLGTESGVAMLVNPRQ